MKIGLVVDHFDPRRGGVEQWTDQLATRLLKAGHEVHVVAGGFGEQYQQPISSREMNSLVCHPIAPHRSRVARAEASQELLQKLSLDVIHDMGVGWYCDILQPHGGSRLAAFRQNQLLEPAWLRPCKRWASHFLPRYRDYDTVMERQYNGDQHRLVLALSEMVRRDLQSLHQVPGERIRLIYNGVDTKRFSPDHRLTHREPVRAQLGLKDEVLFLIVAHNLRLKGVPTLLEAMAKLVTAGYVANLAIVGGKRIAPFQRLAYRLGVDRCVHFVGAVDDAVPYYAAADVYVQPTYYDPCSLVVLEALASGLPVITSRFNGAGELMTPGDHGYLINNPADSQTLADQMALLIDDNLRLPMATAARNLALAHTFDKNVDQVLNIYKEIATAKSHRAGLFAA